VSHTNDPTVVVEYFVVCVCDVCVYMCMCIEI
jgi:hypothetical protein